MFVHCLSTTTPFCTSMEESTDSPHPQHGEGCEVLVGIGELDPPTALIQGFLQRQRDSGTLSLDMDMDMLFMLPTYHTTPQKPNLPSQPISTTLSIPPSPNLSPLVIPNPMNRTMVSIRDNDSIAPPPILDPLLGNSSSTSPSPCKRERNISSSSPSSSTSPSLSSSSSSSLSSSSPSPSPSGSNSEEDEEEELLAPSRRCLRSNSLGGCVRKRSRLADIRYVPLPQALMQQVSNHRSGGKSSQLRSGPIHSGAMLNRARFLGKVNEELLEEVKELEEDPLEGDLPQSFHKTRCGVWYVVEWVAFVIVMMALPCTFALPRLKHRLLVGMELWKWVLLVFLLFSGGLVSRWLVRVVVLLLERSFVMRKKVLYFVYALRRGVQNLLWFTFAVVEWRFVFNPKIESTSPKNLVVLNWVTKLLYCFLIAAIVWLVKIFCVKVVASSFHIKTYFDRIQESLFSQYVLETLSQPPIMCINDLYNDNDSKFMNEVDSLKKAGAKLPECIASLPKQVGAQQKPLATKTTKSGMVPSISKFTTGVKNGIIVGAKSGLLKNGKGNQQQERENGEVGIAINHLHQLNQQNVSAWHMKRLVKFVMSRGISVLVTAMNESATHNKGNTNKQEDGEIQSEWQARLVARKIFKNVAKPGCKSIMVDDLGRFMRLKEVLKAMPLFEGAMESGAMITKDSLKNFVVYVFRERLALALSLKDTKTAVKKLHKIINVVASLIIFVISILVLGLATTHVLLLVSSQLVLVVFIFGNTVKTLFEAIVFLFVMHPFDVGDRCLVEDNQVVVEEMNILSTLFLKSDGEKIWYPNSVLATKRITNYYRTPDTGDTFNFSVHVSTPIEKMTALEENIGRYLASKPNHWTSEMHLVVLEIEDMNRMKIQLMVNHTIDYPDVLERQIRRSNLILEVKRIFEEIGMEYHLLPQDVRMLPFPT